MLAQHVVCLFVLGLTRPRNKANEGIEAAKGQMHYPLLELSHSLGDCSILAFFEEAKHYVAFKFGSILGAVERSGGGRKK